MAEIHALLIPTPNASPHELKALGNAIDAWVREESENNIGAFCDPLPVDDLLAGELPMPLALRETIGPYRIPKELIALIESKGGDPAEVTEDDLEALGIGFEPPKPGALQRAKEELGAAGNFRGVRLGSVGGPASLKA